MPRTALPFGVLASALLAVLPAPTLALDIATCAVTVPAGETGTLTADLACPLDFSGWAVELKNGSTLDLAGHSIIGGYGGVICRDHKCLVRGPGVIAASGEGITCSAYSRRVDVENLTLTGHAHSAVETDSRNVRVSLKNVTLTGNSHDLSLPRGAVNGLHTTVENVTATGNFQYVFRGGVKGSGLVLDGNRYGIYSWRSLRLENSSITNSTGHAVLSIRKARMTNTTLAGNDAADGGIDLLTPRKPKLENTTCSRSRKCDKTLYLDCVPRTDSWDVCSSD